MVNIEWRYQTGFGLGTLLLQPFGIGLEHGSAEWSNAYQFNISFDPIDEHGQFIHPVFAHESAPSGDTPVIVGLIGDIHSSACVEHIFLYILGVWVHGAHLVEIAYLLILTHAREFDKRSIEFDLLLWVWLRLAMSEHILNMSHWHYLIHFESAVIESSQHFGLAEHTLASFG